MDTAPRLGYAAGTPSTGGNSGGGGYPQGPPPPMGPPPAYSAALRRVYPYSMRPVLLISTFISFLYLLIVAIASFRSTSWEHETTRLRLFDVLIGALLVPAAIIEAFGFMAAWTCRFPLARLYSLASILALALTVAADVLAIVQHYAGKGDLIDGCTKDNVGRVGRATGGWGGWFSYNDQGDGSAPWTSEQAQSYCNSQWKRDGIWTIVWLIIILLVGTLFLSFAFTFVQQLRDPSSVRTFRNRNSQRAPPSHAYTSAFNDDDESAPFDRPHGAGAGGAGARYSYDGAEGYAQHAYPPPPGMPPQYQRREDQDDAGDGFDARKRDLASVDLDRKDPNVFSDHDDHPAGLQRAESSRSGAARARRTSEDTLTDDSRRREQPEGDKTPQI